jgi:hypothetical protein
MGSVTLADSRCSLCTGTVREPRGREASTVGSRYRATISEGVTEDTSLCVICNEY